MADLASLADIFVRLTYYLCYLAMAVHFLAKKNNSERLKYLLVVAGIFSIVFLSMGIFSFSGEWDFSLTQMAIMVFLAYTGIPLMVSRELALLLFVVYAISISNSFFLSFFLGAIAYIIVTWGFIFSAVEILGIRLGKSS